MEKYLLTLAFLPTLYFHICTLHPKKGTCTPTQGCCDVMFAVPRRVLVITPQNRLCYRMTSRNYLLSSGHQSSCNPVKFQRLLTWAREREWPFSGKWIAKWPAFDYLCLNQFWGFRQINLSLIQILYQVAK